MKRSIFRYPALGLVASVAVSCASPPSTGESSTPTDTTGAARLVVTEDLRSRLAGLHAPDVLSRAIIQSSDDPPVLDSLRLRDCGELAQWLGITFPRLAVQPTHGTVCATDHAAETLPSHSRDKESEDLPITAFVFAVPDGVDMGSLSLLGAEDACVSYLTLTAGVDTWPDASSDTDAGAASGGYMRATASDGTVLTVQHRGDPATGSARTRIAWVVQGGAEPYNAAAILPTSPVAAVEVLAASLTIPT